MKISELSTRNFREDFTSTRPGRLDSGLPVKDWMALPEDVLSIIRRRVTLDFDPASPENSLESEAVIAAIAGTVEQNLRAGRFKQWLADVRFDDRADWEQYIDLVVRHWIFEHSRVSRLAERDGDAWQQLYDELTLRASSILSRDEILSAECVPAELAARACERVYDTRYPFDVAFMVWATNILVSVILEICADAPVGL